MTLGIKQYLQVPTSTIPEKGSTTSRVHLTFYSDNNSVVGAVNSHTVRPPTCLWASIVLLAPGFTVLGERGETPLMPIGIEQYLQVPTSTIPEEPPTCI